MRDQPENTWNEREARKIIDALGWPSDSCGRASLIYVPNGGVIALSKFDPIFKRIEELEAKLKAVDRAFLRIGAAIAKAGCCGGSDRQCEPDELHLCTRERLMVAFLDEKRALQDTPDT